MKKLLAIAALLLLGLGAYLYSTYKLDQGPKCTQGSPGVDCIQGHQCAGLVSKGKCVTSFNDCYQLGNKKDRTICKVALADPSLT